MLNDWTAIEFYIAGMTAFGTGMSLFLIFGLPRIGRIGRPSWRPRHDAAGEHGK
jgi:hypothetical protein